MRANNGHTGGMLSVGSRPQRKRVGRDPFDTSAITCVSAERQYLAGTLELFDRDITRVRELVGMLTPGMFKGDYSEDVFLAVREAVGTNATPTRADVLTVLRRRAAATGIEASGDPARQLVIDLLSDTIATGMQAARLAADAAREILEAHRRRQAIEITADCVARLQAGTATGDELAVLARELDAVRAATTSANRPVTFKDAVDAWAKHERVPAIRTLLQPFDDATDGGLPVGGLTAFVAPPQVGKSALAMQMSVGALLADDSLAVVYGLGEMTPQALARRAACVGAGLLGLPAVTMHAAGVRSREAYDALQALTGHIGDRMTIVTAPLTVDRLDEQVARTNARLVVCDYVQLVQGEGSDRVQELDGIIGRLRQMAITREAALIVISSMAKSAGTGSRIGQYARGSGEIDYAVELLYLGVSGDRPDEHGIIEVTWECKKARNLPQRDIALRFDGACQTFAPLVEPFPEFNDHRF
jgi:replicative DNA helicase